MTAPLTYEFRFECDELTLNVLHDETQTCFASLKWPEELRTLSTEPDYDELTGTMMVAVKTALATENLAAADEDQMFRALYTAVAPGGRYEPAAVSFAVGAVDKPPVLHSYARDSLTAGPVTVSIDDPGFAGDRQYEVTSIVVERRGVWSQRLTWNEARQLAVALTQMTDVAENG